MLEPQPAIEIKQRTATPPRGRVGLSLELVRAVISGKTVPQRSISSPQNSRLVDNLVVASVAEPRRDAVGRRYEVWAERVDEL